MIRLRYNEMHGGLRAGAGRPKGSKDVRYGDQSSRNMTPEPNPAALPTNYTGQEWLRIVINDPNADPSRRDRAAIAMANIEAKAAEAVGKKAQAEMDANTVGGGSRWESLVNRGRVDDVETRLGISN